MSKAIATPIKVVVPQPEPTLQSSLSIYRLYSTVLGM
jgi:hypothetical protein